MGCKHKKKAARRKNKIENKIKDQQKQQADSRKNQTQTAEETEKLVLKVLEQAVDQISDYKNGKKKALMSIVGMVMKASRGKANPEEVQEILKNVLGHDGK